MLNIFLYTDFNPQYYDWFAKAYAYKDQTQ